MSSRNIRVAAAIGGIAVGAFFLWLALRDADLAAVQDAVASADLGLVALAVGAFAVVYAFQSARWRRIAATPRVRLARFYEMTVSGVAVNNVLPGRIGDLLRARWLGLAARIPSGRAFGTVIIDRICDLVILVGLLLIGIAAVASSEWLVNLAVGGVLLLVVVGVVLLLTRSYVRSRGRDRRDRGLVRRLARDTAETLAEPLDRRRALAWLALSTCAWTAWAVAALLVARALGIELSLPEALFVTAVLNLGSAIPSSPGFVGTYEWLGVASLGLVGVDHEPALAFTILLHAAWYAPTTIFGGIALGVRGGLRLRRMRAASTGAEEPTVP
jgi:glycosyltransferase 2 family protein